MRRTFLLAIALATAITPLAAQDDGESTALLERRLRACLAAGAPGAPRDSLLTAIVALRSLCHTQINRVQDLRLREVDESFGLPGARLTVTEQDRVNDARRRAIRQLNHEIGMAVSSFTGLTE